MIAMGYLKQAPKNVVWTRRIEVHPLVEQAVKDTTAGPRELPAHLWYASSELGDQWMK